jgi:hypothetical protein
VSSAKASSLASGAKKRRLDAEKGSHLSAESDKNKKPVKFTGDM